MCGPPLPYCVGLPSGLLSVYTSVKVIFSPGKPFLFSVPVLPLCKGACWDDEGPALLFNLREAAPGETTDVRLLL